MVKCMSKWALKWEILVALPGGLAGGITQTGFQMGCTQIGYHKGIAWERQQQI